MHGSFNINRFVFLESIIFGKLAEVKKNKKKMQSVKILAHIINQHNTNPTYK